MIKITDLTIEELNTVSRQIADSFYDYKYKNDDQGLLKYIKGRQNMFIYIKAIITAAYKSGLLYTTSENHEGFLFIAGHGIGSIEFFDGIKMILAEKKALGGWKNLKTFVKDCFSNGGSIESRTKKAKKKFIRIEVLVVRKEFQKQGFMRQMMEYVYNIAEEKKAAVILDTDDEDKCKRYEHLGMKLDRIRNCSSNFHMYDLIREF